MKIIVTILLVLVVLLAAVVGFVYSGTYNVAASSADEGVVHWLLETTQERGIAKQAREISPPALDSAERSARGLALFHSTCIVCHGGPGIKPTEIGLGMNPRPPDLAHEVEEFTEAELFWVAKHGIKMTGMPGFGSTHSDDQLWDVVAFLQELPELSYGEYQNRLQEQGITGSAQGATRGPVSTERGPAAAAPSSASEPAAESDPHPTHGLDEPLDDGPTPRIPGGESGLEDLLEPSPAQPTHDDTEEPGLENLLGEDQQQDGPPDSGSGGGDDASTDEALATGGAASSTREGTDTGVSGARPSADGAGRPTGGATTGGGDSITGGAGGDAGGVPGAGAPGAAAP